MIKNINIKHNISDNVDLFSRGNNEHTIDGSSVLNDAHVILRNDWITRRESTISDISILDTDNNESTYSIEKKDSDGNDFFGDDNIKRMLLVDNSSAGFGDPVSGLHTGCARDGKFYFNGNECSLGVFGTLANGFNHLSWRNSEEEPFKINTSTGSMSVTADDVVSMSATLNGWEPGPVISSDNKWYLQQGDFDIEMSFSGLSAGYDTSLEMSSVYNLVGNEGTNRVSLGRTRNHYAFMRVHNGSWSEIATGGGNDATGKLRLTRVSSTYHAYYWNGSSWVEIGSGYSHPHGSLDVYAMVSTSGSNGNSISVDISSFGVNSGTVVNTSGWYREDPSANRGSRRDMPESLLVSTSDGSVDLIDVDSDKLWMRFINANDNMVFKWDYATPDNVEWNNGVLIVSNHYGSSDRGGGIVIDFTEDTSRIYMGPSENPGRHYSHRDDRASGVISLRNNGNGWGSPESSWEIQTNRTLSSSIYMNGIYEYHAIGTESGVSVFRKIRWNRCDSPNLESTKSTETGRMIHVKFRDTDGELFYCDGNHIMSIPMSTWESSLGGTFSASTSKPVPSHVSHDSQYRFTVKGSVIYFISDIGVHSIAWPSGSMYFLVGGSGSGAAHEVLPQVISVRSMLIEQDSGTDIMVLGLDTNDSCSAIAINMSTWTVYGKTKRSIGKTVISLGV